MSTAHARHAVALLRRGLAERRTVSLLEPRIRPLRAWYLSATSIRLSCSGLTTMPIHDVAIKGICHMVCPRPGAASWAGRRDPPRRVFDIATFGAVPRDLRSLPMDELELRNMMYTGLPIRPSLHDPLPAQQQCGTSVAGAVPFEALPVGRGRRLREGTDVALVTVGTVGNAAARAAERARRRA